MKKRFFLRFLLPALTLSALGLAACNKNTDAPAPIPVAPAGVTHSTLRQGTVLAQGGVMSGGVVALAQGSDGVEYV